MKYFFTNRHGGYSKEPFDSFNTALHVGDDPMLVHRNRKELLAQSGVARLVFMEQVHGVDIKRVDKDSIARQFVCDGLVTELKDVGLCVMVADCVPLIFYDATCKAIGVAHAGRKGSFANIAAKMCEKMENEYNCKAWNLEVKIGPCIRACCYEVGQKEVLGFETFAKKTDESFYLDLVSLNKAQLLQAGVKKENIQDSNICSCCDRDYFSYRREKQTGRCCGLVYM